MRFEKYWFIRILPLFLKKIGMKIGYHVQGTDANTISFSNLGKVELPKDMEKYISNSFDYEYSNGIVEGINNAIKQIKHTACGYKKFNHLKARVMLIKGLLNPIHT